MLARRLSMLHLENPVVLALPRGGVPVAAEVARALRAPLDVLVVRKLGCPWHPELGMGAVAEGGTRSLNETLIARLDLDPGEIDRIAAGEEAELAERVRQYRGARPRTPVDGATAVLVDDGIATGFTARAGIEVLRKWGAERVVLATPVAPPGVVADLRRAADDVIVLATPDPLVAIGQEYLDFTEVFDGEVIDLLRSLAPAGSCHVPRADPERSCIPVPLGPLQSAGELAVPADPRGIVVFAHGSASHRGPRHRIVAEALHAAGLATLVFDLLSPSEAHRPHRVFDIELLAERLVRATEWLGSRREVQGLPVGYYGASTGAAAALCAAAEFGPHIRAVVSRGGRPDLAGMALVDVTAPTLLIVGSRDPTIKELNREPLKLLRRESRLQVVPGATHLFEEPGALDRVATLAREWFVEHMTGPSAEAGPPQECGLVTGQRGRQQAHR